MRIRLILLTAVAMAALALAAPAMAAGPPGYVRVSTDPINAPSSALDTGGQIACPVGTVVWGGGVSFTGGQFALGESINTTAPNGSTMWRARYNNTTGRTIPIVIHAVCANQPGSYSMQFATADNPPHTQSNAIAICPSNAVLLSGGAFSTSDKASVFMLSDFPVTQRKFRVVMWNGSDQDERVTAFAICGHRPAGYTITQQSFTTMVNGNTLLASGAQCPAPTRVIGGGVKVTAPNPNVVPASSLDEPNTQWISDTLVANAATVTQTNYAICAGLTPHRGP